MQPLCRWLRAQTCRVCGDSPLQHPLFEPCSASLNPTKPAMGIANPHQSPGNQRDEASSSPPPPSIIPGCPEQRTSQVELRDGT